MIGRKLVLWNYEGRSNAYTDQFGMRHNANILTREVVVTIVESKPVKGSYTNDDLLGYRAEDSEGHSYYNNWENFDDLSSTPRACWFDYDRMDQMWDAVQIRKAAMYPILRPDGTLAVPPHTKSCEQHDTIFYEYDECYKCRFEQHRRSN